MIKNVKTNKWSRIKLKQNKIKYIIPTLSGDVVWMKGLYEQTLFYLIIASEMHPHPCAIVIDKHFEFFCQFATLELACNRAVFAIPNNKCVQWATYLYKRDYTAIVKTGEILCFNVVWWKEIIVFLDCDCLLIVRSHENCSIAEGNISDEREKCKYVPPPRRFPRSISSQETYGDIADLASILSKSQETLSFLIAQ